jgi:hypothetical protein
MIRTCNLLIRSQMLYPLSYERWGRQAYRLVSQRLDGYVAEKEGFEPSDPVSQVPSLAVRSIRPLSHFSMDSTMDSLTQRPAVSTALEILRKSR